MSAKVLVTGAGGFIGSHLVEALLRTGREVRAFVRYNSMSSWGWLEQCPTALRDGLEVFSGDIRDHFAVQRAVTGCGTIFHLAALIGIPYSYESPESYVATNVTGTLNLLQAARNSEVEHVIHTSTSEVYGTPEYVPIDEGHPIRAQSPYAATKIAADQMALSFYRSFETPVSVLRPFNTFGPRQSARAVIPTIIGQITQGKESVRLGSLSPTREFNFVSDTVSAFLAVADEKAGIGAVMNAGNGYEIAIGSLARIIGECMDVDLAIETDPARVRPDASEVERLCADGCRLRAACGWTPRYEGEEGLRAGLAETIEWFREPSNVCRYKSDLYNV